MNSSDEAPLRARMAQHAAEGRHTEREAATWHLAELTMGDRSASIGTADNLSGAFRGCATRLSR
jgi:hypothetical protein